MRYKKYFFSFFLIVLSCGVLADQPGKSLSTLMQAVEEKDWEEANRLFGITIKENVKEAEDFYWINLKDSCPIRKDFALKLGNYYKKRRNYEKACNFYSEAVRLVPKNIDYLLLYAESEVLSGKEKEALTTYERVLSLDVDNLPANIFMGNYYFFQAEKIRERIENKYAGFKSPTRMQYAAYREKLEDIVNTGYVKAQVYLERAAAVFPSAEIHKTLKVVKELKIRLESSRDPLLPSRRKFP